MSVRLLTLYCTFFFCSSPNKNHLEKSCGLWFILKMWTLVPPGKTKVFQSTALWDQNLRHACGTEGGPHSEGETSFSMCQQDDHRIERTPGHSHSVVLYGGSLCGTRSGVVPGSCVGKSALQQERPRWHPLLLTGCLYQGRPAVGVLRLP